MAARRRSRKQWSELVTKFRESGERTSKFCARHQLSVRTFTWRRWHLSDDARATPVPKERSVRLIAVDVKAPLVMPAAPGAVHIRLADLDVHVEVGTDLGYVVALVEALRARC
jgi:hypothetical protein